MSSLKHDHEHGHEHTHASEAAPAAGTNHSPYWRSLSELEAQPQFTEFLKREFPESATGAPGSFSRRRFMQLMGASIALSSAACRWPKENIMELSRRPAGAVPGKPRHFATAIELAGVGTGLLMTSYEGRPIKVEGNPKHPDSRGGTSAIQQAVILELYDPERTKTPMKGAGDAAQRADWKDFEGAMRPLLSSYRANGGAGFAILSEATSSPTLATLRAQLAEAMPQATWTTYEPVSMDNELAGTKLAFGAPFRAHYNLTKAKVIVALDCDLLGAHPAHLGYARDWAAGRNPESGAMNRLYAVESRFTLTGAAADHRLPLRSAQVKPFLLAIEAMLSGGAAPTQGFLGDANVQKHAKAIAADLNANRGTSVLAVGANQPAEVHALAARINTTLGNGGSTVSFLQVADEPSSVAGITTLAKALHAGKVEALVVLGGNPAHDAPADLDFATAIGKAKTSAHLTLAANETSARCGWVLPRAHFLEAWGDTRAWDGTVTIAQPLIAPLYEGRSALELVAYLAGETKPALELVQNTLRQLQSKTTAAAPAGLTTAQATPKAEAAAPIDPAQALAGPGVKLPAFATEFERTWSETLHAGVVSGTAFAAVTPSVQAFEVKATAPTAIEAKNGELELTFFAHAHIYDGRFANNGWLQETPDFITKVTWDNALLMSPKTAETLGVKNETLVKLSVGGKDLEVAAFVLPGQATGSLALALGYGRAFAGMIGGSRKHDVAPVGFDAYPLRTTSGMDIVQGASVTATGKEHQLASTQDHWAIDTTGYDAREQRAGILIREASLEHHKSEPEWAKHMVHVPKLDSLWKEHEYNGHRWGMAIDLSACTGCNACVVACTAENNVPIVGKEQVLKNREMHWLRIDRYFKGAAENPTIAHQPLTCQQCETAPCEQVCPATATVHTSEGLNDMVYNRCVGTRYCANNCPYKVRKFNYFNFHEDLKEPANDVKKLAFNPEVTVRARGVMEKCTYCVQRIVTTRIQANNDKRPIQDGEIVSACQQACPTQAIAFGDLADKNSRVAKMQELARSYAILAELNTKPRTQYLGKVKNTNPALA